MIKYSPNGGCYYPNEFYFSAAYQSLANSARNLLHCFLNELRWKEGRGKNRKFINNGEVSFTEIQFKAMFGSASATYLNARNQLIRVGIIRQTYRGGNCRGDMAKYKILALTNLPTREERWREYPQRNWGKDIPRVKETLVGVKTRFKSGQSGRKH